MTAQECRNMFCKNEKCCFLLQIVRKSFTYPNCFKIIIHVRTKLNVFGTQKSLQPLLWEQGIFMLGDKLLRVYRRKETKT